ncbi:S-adenosylmethionine synthetase [Corynebacterium sp.]|uniref:S-adenosylmethionine synthetase n=1 Tax=Corynebacterium sp. TaxID=1720 RepID=UPI0026DC49EF|nr:S-adenosylmethionine synthetase [Corynebacterium sp.]MDO5031803.1 S-adenosylmethionine synthetase [Corynebacterium sp.]
MSPQLRRCRGGAGTLCALLAVAGAAVGACGVPPSERAEEQAPQIGRGGELSAAARKEVGAELDAVITRVEREFDVRAGVSVADVQGTLDAGIPGEEPTWSTVKLPIAIVAAGLGAEDSVVDLAIKESDNDAAYALWMTIAYAEGDPVAAVEDFVATHDSRAQLQDPFGYSTWLLEDQARFARNLSCMPEAEHVYKAMGEIVHWQRNGLSALQNSRAKGGWGLSELDDTYTHRQVGVRSDGHGDLGVALEVTMPSEAAGDAEDALNALAEETDHVLARALHSGALQAVEHCEPGAAA